MFSGLKKFIGYIDVQQTPTRIIIDGIPGFELMRDIQNKWQTSKINTQMFILMNRNKVVFGSFFAIDVLYILTALLNDPGSRFPKRILRKTIDELVEKTWLKDIAHEERHNRINFSKLDEISFKMLPHQMEFLENYNRVTSSYRLNGMLLAAAPGSGKACRASTLVKIPGGWKRIGKLKVGDDITNIEGNVSKVTGVYPQGELPLYRVTFWDGRTAEVCEDHLWWTYNKNAVKHNQWKVRDTKELINTLSGTDCRIYIPLCASEQSQDVDLSIDPYLLGVLLGDGCLRNSCMLSTPDDFILDEVKRLLPVGLSINHRSEYDYSITGNGKTNSLTAALRELDLFGKFSYEKHIPFMYFNGSHEQRLSLLQGLMDTDGTVDVQGTSSYSTSSPQLALDVQKLVWSLGGICRIAHKKPYYTHNGVKLMGRLNYQLNIRFKKPSDLFRMPRKRDRAPDTNQYSKGLKLQIRSIEPIGVDEAVCISVDHSSKLFVIDDYVVTHNTLTGLAVASCVEADVVIMIVPKNSLERVWEATMRDNLTQEPKYWVSKNLGELPPKGLRYYAFHYEALDRAIYLAGQIDKGAKVCIILDECHNFNEINSTRTKLFVELCEKTKSKDVIWSSGTPIKALGFEAIPLLKTIDPFFNDMDTEQRFRKIFGRDANKANDILRNRIGLVSFKVVKKDVVKGEVIYNTLKIKIPNSDKYTLDTIRYDMSVFIDERMKYYNSHMTEIRGLYTDCLSLHKGTLSSSDMADFNLYNTYIKTISGGYDARTMQVEVMFCNKYELQKIIPSLPDMLKKQFKSARSVIKYLQLKVMGEALGGVLGKRRSQCHVDMIEHIGLERLVNAGTKKTVIFTSYVEVVDKVANHLEEREFAPIKVYGDTNKHLAVMIKNFDSDESVNPLVATYQSLSTAVPLIMANNMIMLNAPFRDHEREQAIARCDRLGQDSPVTVTDIYLDTGDVANISTRSKDILEWSKAAVASIMGVSVPLDLSLTMESYASGDIDIETSQKEFLSKVSKVFE